jgi:protein TonB
MAAFTRHSPTGLPAPLFHSYSVRMMLSLAASLLLIALCFHLPLKVQPDRIGWQPASHLHEPMLELVDVREQRSDEGSGVPITVFSANEEDIDAGDDEEAEEEREAEVEALPTPSALPILEKLKVRPALDYAEQMPDIAGGMGAYYIHINYPDAAIEQGIEGRMVLAFVVEPDGSPTEIEVFQSLHPLCDSAAVDALRKTRFIPGRQNGRIVRVRMRLPVRFQLISAEPADSTNAAPSASL